ncbi:hypothetical protein JL09_g4703, partial [Pichia kudriavzevii]
PQSTPSITTSETETAVVTVTSCSDNKCHISEVTVTDTSTETTCPESSQLNDTTKPTNSGTAAPEVTRTEPQAHSQTETTPTSTPDNPDTTNTPPETSGSAGTPAPPLTSVLPAPPSTTATPSASQTSSTPINPPSTETHPSDTGNPSSTKGSSEAPVPGHSATTLTQQQPPFPAPSSASPSVSTPEVSEGSIYSGLAGQITANGVGISIALLISAILHI